MGLSENVVYPIYPMVCLIIIPFLNGYFIGNTIFSDIPTWKLKICDAQVVEFRLLPVMMATHGHVVRSFGAPKDHQPSGKPWVPAQLLE